MLFGDHAYMILQKLLYISMIVWKWISCLTLAFNYLQMHMVLQAGCCIELLVVLQYRIVEMLLT